MDASHPWTTPRNYEPRDGFGRGDASTARSAHHPPRPAAMNRRPIEARIDPGRDDPDRSSGVAGEAFRDALSHWASTITVVAARDGADVYATTVTSFFPVSAEPPLIAVSLGPNAQVLPWLEPGAPFTVSFLAAGQGRLASTFADSFPVGPSPFPAEGDPVVAGGVAALVCSVRQIRETEGGARLVLGRVEETVELEGSDPLLYHRRGYRRLADDG